MTLTEQVRAFFLAHPDQPIKHTDCARMFGIGGFRSRISEARKVFGMDIRAKQIAVKVRGTYVQRALYTYYPKRSGKRVE